ncbi:ring-opening amidohydrolase [Leptothoe sp. PORK10 BA2]|uniref:ring-opening amidohydrolase n=1 Tax=Leptothoe sp. PORK10 BA2 TaxID=3110254 RepID=UPI003FA3DDEB
MPPLRSPKIYVSGGGEHQGVSGGGPIAIISQFAYAKGQSAYAKGFATHADVNPLTLSSISYLQLASESVP